MNENEFPSEEMPEGIHVTLTGDEMQMARTVAVMRSAAQPEVKLANNEFLCDVNNAIATLQAMAYPKVYLDNPKTDGDPKTAGAYARWIAWRFTRIADSLTSADAMQAEFRAAFEATAATAGVEPSEMTPDALLRIAADEHSSLHAYIDWRSNVEIKQEGRIGCDSEDEVIQARYNRARDLLHMYDPALGAPSVSDEEWEDMDQQVIYEDGKEYYEASPNPNGAGVGPFPTQVWRERVRLGLAPHSDG